VVAQKAGRTFGTEFKMNNCAHRMLIVATSPSRTAFVNSGNLPILPTILSV